MCALHVHVLGTFRVLSNDAVLAGFDANRPRELLSYLLLHRQRSYPREALAEQLWGDAAGSPPRKQLRQTLWQLQRALQPGEAPGHPAVLLVEGESIRIHPDADVWCDAVAFEQACGRARDRAGGTLDLTSFEALQATAALYEGDLLAGCYRDWCLYERERLQNLYVLLLHKLIEYCLASGRYEAGVAYGERVLEYERAHERTYRQLMRLYYFADDRTAAIRQYQRCVRALADELGVQPAARTTTLYEQIRTDRLETAGAPLAELPPRPRQGARPPTDQPGRLTELRTLLKYMRGQLVRDIATIDDMLTGWPRPTPGARPVESDDWAMR
jgi:DNA-binding SARP family transcriptional activator